MKFPCRGPRSWFLSMRRSPKDWQPLAVSQPLADNLMLLAHS